MSNGYIVDREDVLDSFVAAEMNMGPGERVLPCWGCADGHSMLLAGSVTDAIEMAEQANRLAAPNGCRYIASPFLVTVQAYKALVENATPPEEENDA